MLPVHSRVGHALTARGGLTAAVQVWTRRSARPFFPTPNARMARQHHNLRSAAGPAVSSPNEDSSSTARLFAALQPGCRLLPSTSNHTGARRHTTGPTNRPAAYPAQPPPAGQPRHEPADSKLSGPRGLLKLLPPAARPYGELARIDKPIGTCETARTLSRARSLSLFLSLPLALTRPPPPTNVVARGCSRSVPTA